MSTWKEDFPIRQSEEHKSSRRQFAQFLGVGAAGFCCAGALNKTLFPKPVHADASPLAIADDDELQPGESKLFRYPTEHDPAILVRLADGTYKAYDQRCTHLMCPVHFKPEKESLYCPCHHGSFDAADGSVQYGPPQRALPEYDVEVRDGKLWASLPAQSANPQP